MASHPCKLGRLGGMPRANCRHSDMPNSVYTRLHPGPMHPLRALPRVVPTQPTHAAIHAEAEA